MHRTLYRCLACACSALALVATSPVQAHGYWPPQHGGIMRYYEDEISFELVRVGKDEIHIHASDHGTPLAADGAQGKLWIKNRQRKPGEPSEWGHVLLPRGDRFVLRGVTLGDQDEVSVRVSFPSRIAGAGGFDLARQGAPMAARSAPTKGFGGLRLPSFAAPLFKPAAPAGAASAP